jgi:hypothetical protein
LITTVFLDASNVFPSFPAPLRKELIDSYDEIVRRYREGNWEPSELNGGKFCEIVYSIISGHGAGAFPPSASKPANMVDACRALEKLDSQKFSRSVRIQIPRVLLGIYEVRNNRGVGHVGGDVDANEMDARFVLHACQWVMAELVRVFHGVDIETATNTVATLSERVVPVVWDVGGKSRVLDTSLSAKEKTLILLYKSPKSMPASTLCASLEYSTLGNYKRDVLRKLHAERIVEFDEDSGFVSLSPTGVHRAEQVLQIR